MPAHSSVSWTMPIRLARIGLLASLAVLPLAAAHGVITHLTVDGVKSAEGQICVPYRWDDLVDDKTCANVRVNDNGWVPGDYTSNEMRCGVGKNNGSTTPAGQYISAQAGSSVGITWDTLACDSHYGPMDTYISRCANDDCTTYQADGDWIKIDQQVEKDGEWINQWACKNDYTITFKIPAVPEGKYLVRHQWIALHAAFRMDGAQIYPNCINFDIKGGNTGDGQGLTPTGKIPGMYKDTDPGIYFDLYTDTDAPAKINERSLVYQDPGVALCEICGGNASSAPASQAPATSAQPTASIADKGVDADSSQPPSSAPATQAATEAEADASETAQETSDASKPAQSSPSEPSQSAPKGTAGSASMPTQGAPVNTKCRMKKRHIRRKF